MPQHYWLVVCCNKLNTCFKNEGCTPKSVREFFKKAVIECTYILQRVHCKTLPSSDSTCWCTEGKAWKVILRTSEYILHELVDV